MYQTQTKPSSSEAQEAARNKGKPFCKVCFDAGKPASEYNSHYVKSSPGPNGKVACPTLLNQACLNCGQPGHTSGYCLEPKSHQPKSHQPKSHQPKSHQPNANLRHRPHESNQRIQPMQAADFPSLNPRPEPNHQEPNQEPTHGHVYNPRSNAFGALSQKQPKQPKQPKPINQSNQANQQLEAKPMTMAERLKNPPVKAVATKTTPTSTFKFKFADMPPKSQFWWQDED